MTDNTLANAEYNDAADNWQLVRDLIKGESALKQHDIDTVNAASISTSTINNFKLNHRYLPMPNPDDSSDRNLLRYAQYVQRASLFNATKRTEQGMSGMVFSKPSEVDLPEGLAYLEDDADGSDVGISQQATEVLNDILETGREGLLVDYPQRERATTQAELEEQGVRASICIYKAESILDWECRRIGAKQVLSMVKLFETYTERSEDLLNVEVKSRIRVLILNNEGNYEVRIYDTDSDIIKEQFLPTDANGATLKSIPFFFVGSVNNRPNIDPAPLIEVAEVNLAHYRNSADFEESEFITGQPTLAIAGLSQSWANEFMASGVALGARAGILLPEGGSASMLQPSPNTLPETGMTRKEKQMVELGARLIQSGGAAETAEAARIKHSADASVLSIIVRNMNQAYSDAIAACQLFNGGSGDYTFKINDEFFSDKLDSNGLNSLVSAWQSGAISKAVLDQKLVQGGVIDEDVDLEEMNEEINDEPSGVNFD